MTAERLLRETYFNMLDGQADENTAQASTRGLSNISYSLPWGLVTYAGRRREKGVLR